MSIPRHGFNNMESALAALQKTLSWFRSNPELRRYTAVSSIDEQKLRLIDRFIHEGLVQGADEVNEDEIRALIDATLSLERAVISEILPVVKMRLTQRGPASNTESITRLRMTRESIEPNARRLVQQVCELRVAALTASRVA